MLIYNSCNSKIIYFRFIAYVCSVGVLVCCKYEQLSNGSSSLLCLCKVDWSVSAV